MRNPIGRQGKGREWTVMPLECYRSKQLLSMRVQYSLLFRTFETFPNETLQTKLDSHRFFSFHFSMSVNSSQQSSETSTPHTLPQNDGHQRAH